MVDCTNGYNHKVARFFLFVVCLAPVFGLSNYIFVVTLSYAHHVLLACFLHFYVV